MDDIQTTFAKNGLSGPQKTFLQEFLPEIPHLINFANVFNLER